MPFRESVPLTLAIDKLSLPELHALNLYIDTIIDVRTGTVERGRPLHTIPDEWKVICSDDTNNYTLYETQAGYVLTHQYLGTLSVAASGTAISCNLSVEDLMTAPITDIVSGPTPAVYVLFDGTQWVDVKFTTPNGTPIGSIC